MSGSTEHREQQANATREACMLHTLRHPNIVSFLGVVLTHGTNDIQWIVTELADCDLNAYLVQQRELHGGVSYPVVVKCLTHCLLALLYMHSKRPEVMHRDVKPSNIMVRISSAGDVEFKLGDVGLATALKIGDSGLVSASAATTASSVMSARGGSASTVVHPAMGGAGVAYTVVGTPVRCMRYFVKYCRWPQVYVAHPSVCRLLALSLLQFTAAPEVYGEDGYGVKSDVFSLGVSMAFAVVGFMQRDDGPLVADPTAKYGITGRFRMVKDAVALLTPVCPELATLIKRMTKSDPSARLDTAAALTMAQDIAG